MEYNSDSLCPSIRNLKIRVSKDGIWIICASIDDVVVTLFIVIDTARANVPQSNPSRTKKNKKQKSGRERILKTLFELLLFEDLLSLSISGLLPLVLWVTVQGIGYQSMAWSLKYPGVKELPGGWLNLEVQPWCTLWKSILKVFLASCLKQQHRKMVSRIGINIITLQIRTEWHRCFF